MKNQDMQANQHPPIKRSSGEIVIASIGETKREKAFWQVYSTMIGNSAQHYETLAIEAIEAVNAGFKALESDNE